MPSRVLKKEKSCFDPSTLLRAGKLSTNGKYSIISSSSPFALRFSKGERWVFQHPAIEQSSFWSAGAQKYDQVVDLQIGPKTRSMVRERLAREGHLGKVAEIGCGTGFYTQVLAAKADNVLATDISPRMLALAQERISAANVTFQVEDCQKMSSPDETFDTVFISLVIHFTRPEKTLAEMHRILRPGGMLIIANLDPGALTGLDRARCLIRILYYGLTRYRTRPPKGFAKNIITEKDLL